MIRKHRMVARNTLVGRAAQFAAGVAERYGGPNTQRLPQLSRVLQRMRRIVVASGGGSVTFAPRIDVRVASFGRHASEAPLVARSAMVVVARSTPRTVSAPSSEPLLRRSLTRTVRSEGNSNRNLVTAPSGAPERSAPSPTATQVERVLRRRASAVVEDLPLVQRDERSMRVPSQPPRPQQLSPIEVARLTDHIVHTIDRRISAFRERQGRV